jgi:hypothetical protein
VLVPAELVLVAVDLDVLVADLLGDLALVGHGFGVEADALAGHGPLVDHRGLLVVEGDLVLSSELAGRWSRRRGWRR